MMLLIYIVDIFLIYKYYLYLLLTQMPKTKQERLQLTLDRVYKMIDKLWYIAHPYEHKSSINKQHLDISQHDTLISRLEMTIETLDKKSKQNLQMCQKIVQLSLSRSTQHIWRFDLTKINFSKSSLLMENLNKIRSLNLLVDELFKITKVSNEDKLIQKIKDMQLKNSKYQEFINYLYDFDQNYIFDCKYRYISAQFQQKIQQVKNAYKMIADTANQLKNYSNTTYKSTQKIRFKDIAKNILQILAKQLDKKNQQSSKWKHLNNCLIYLKHNNFEKIQDYDQSFQPQTRQNINSLKQEIKITFDKSQQIINKLNICLNSPLQHQGNNGNVFNNLKIIQSKVERFMHFFQKAQSVPIISERWSKIEKTNILDISLQILQEYQQLSRQKEYLNRSFKVTRKIYEQLFRSKWGFLPSITPQQVNKKEDDLINQIKSMKAQVKQYDQLIKQCNQKDNEIERLKHKIIQIQNMQQRPNNFGVMPRLTNLYVNKPNIFQEKKQQTQWQQKYLQLSKQHDQLNHKYRRVQSTLQQYSNKLLMHKVITQEFASVQSIVRQYFNKQDPLNNSLEKMSPSIQLNLFILKSQKKLQQRNQIIKKIEKQKKVLEGKVNDLVKEKNDFQYQLVLKNRQLYELQQYKKQFISSKQIVSKNEQLQKHISQNQRQISLLKQQINKRQRIQSQNETKTRIIQSLVVQKQTLQFQNDCLKKQRQTKDIETAEINQYKQALANRQKTTTRQKQILKMIRQRLSNITISQIKKISQGMIQSLNLIKFQFFSFYEAKLKQLSQKIISKYKQRENLQTSQVKNQNKRITQQVEELKSQISNYQKQRYGLQKDYTNCEIIISRLKKELNNQKGNVQILNGQLKFHQLQTQQLNMQLQQLKQEKTIRQNKIEKKSANQSKISESLTREVQQKFEKQLKVLKRTSQKLYFQQNKQLNKIKHAQQIDPFYLLFVHQLFQGEALQEKIQYKYRILFHLHSLTKKTVYKTRIIYKFDLKNETSFHEYIDNLSNLLCVMKTTSNVYLAGYYSGQYANTAMKQAGMLISITNNESFQLKKSTESKDIPLSMVYDPFFINFGKAEICIRPQESTVSTNFGIPTSYFETRDKSLNDFFCLGSEREANLVSFQIYKIIFQAEEQIS